MPYDLYVTIANISKSLANLVSINIDQRGLSGVTLLSENRVEFDTINPCDSQIAHLRLLSQKTGRVFATAKHPRSLLGCQHYSEDAEPLVHILSTEHPVIATVPATSTPSRREVRPSNTTHEPRKLGLHCLRARACNHLLPPHVRLNEVDQSTGNGKPQYPAASIRVRLDLQLILPGPRLHHCLVHAVRLIVHNPPLTSGSAQEEVYRAGQHGPVQA